jgi:hypothetical protein
MPDRLLLHRRVAAALLITAYVLLVGTVVVGCWWIQRKFDDAEHDRCSLAATQLALATVELSVIANPSRGDLIPLTDLDPQLREILDDLNANLTETCPSEYLK